MNKYVILSLTVIAVILAFFTHEVLTQKIDTKITIFHESIKAESIGDYQKAIDKLLGIYKENQNDYLINLRLGWLYNSIEKYKESREYYTKAVAASDKKSIEALLGLTLPLAAMNEWSLVKMTYNDILKIDNNNYTANLRLGQLTLNAGDYVSAKEFLEKAYNNYPSNYDPNLSLGYTYFYLGDKKKAENHLKNALMFSPGDSLALKGLSLLK